ncbi:hypothetical protein [Streptomyces sp. NPDC093225]|uniref:hypothetical protein n=1 Tax=Streptomyces sp. NPDC093225 TaxID=3366034 RepID=UPI0037F7537E
MDDVPQGGAGGAPLHEDTPQDRRRRPHAGPVPERGRRGPADEAGDTGAGRTADEGGRGADRAGRGAEKAEPGGDALSPSPRAQQRSARRRGEGVT